MGKTLLYSVWGLALVSLTALLLTQEIGLLVSLTTIAWLSVTFYWERKGALKKIIWLENVAILLLFSAAVSQFLLTKTSFLMIVAHFLIGFTLLKLSLQKTRNDLIQIIALSFFLLLSASTLALDFSYIMSFILYVLTATWTLSLYSLTAEENQKEQSLNIKRIFRSIVWNCGLTLCLVLFFSISIFVFFPRISLAVFQGAFLGPAQKSGISEKMNLIQHGKIFEDPAIAMRVEIPDDQKNRIHRGYLRGQTLS
ncbi:MAG: DUF3488 domain-containing protein, partial [Elusimicrobia bacterium]|nr:DUF3488 domain-containing protein [Elusimicrobiota bacterium]